MTKKLHKKGEEEKEKEGLKGYTPRWANSWFSNIRTVSRNRNEIDAKKRFWAPNKEKETENEKKWQKNERKWKKTQENERKMKEKWKKMKENARKWKKM